MPEHQLAGYARFEDLAKVFDDDDIALFSNAVRDDNGMAEKQNAPAGVGFASSSSSLWGNPGSSNSFLHQNPTATQQQEEAQQLKLQQQQQQPSSAPEEFVSAYVVIDPAQPDRILVPHQLLTYTPPGSTEALSASWGPVVLPSSLLSASSSTEFLPHQALPPPQAHQAPSLPAAPVSKQQQQQELLQASFVYTPQIDNTTNPSDNTNKEPMGLDHNNEKLSMLYSLASSSSTAVLKRGPSPDLDYKVSPPAPNNRKNKKTCRAASEAEAADEPDAGDDGKPKLLKPLTAYNFYYRDERDNIVQAEGDGVPPPVSDFSEAKRQKLLEDRWLRDPEKGKRKHRRTHGKMQFTQLSRVIAQRWNGLPEHGKDFYRRLAKADWNRYQDAVKQSEPAAEPAAAFASQPFPPSSSTPATSTAETTSTIASAAAAAAAAALEDPSMDDGSGTGGALHPASSSMHCSSIKLKEQQDGDGDDADSETGSWNSAYLELASSS